MYNVLSKYLDKVRYIHYKVLCLSLFYIFVRRLKWRKIVLPPGTYVYTLITGLASY